jgi:hypothetical protein
LISALEQCWLVFVLVIGLLLAPIAILATAAA